jgi:hypothetical protein
MHPFFFFAYTREIKHHQSTCKGAGVETTLAIEGIVN